ncbi:MAG: PQQ-dependent sugar dehydrogenase [Ginsengibacter sp.]|jgi:glucose/arabinose dehydrogenase
MRSLYIPKLLTGFLILFSLLGCNNSQTPSEKEIADADISGRNDSLEQDRLFQKYKLDKIVLPEGFKIQVYAEVPNARSMTLSPAGTLFVGTQKNSVYAIPDKNKDGKADKVYEIVRDLDAPNGVAFRDGNLFIGAISTIYRIDNIEANLASPAKPVIVYDKFPSDKHHGYKFIAFGPDGKLYVPVGAPCNICEPKKPVYASITRMNPDGTDFEIFASGVRNTVGFDWNPNTKEIWFTDNGRDLMGNDIPNDELNTAPKAGMHFGYPYCHQGDILDPEFGKGKKCSDYTAPVKLMGPHVAALGMRFNKENKFPAEYQDAIFIAEHGSWNRTIPIGYRISVVKMDAEGKLKEPSIFAEGWLQNVRDVSGRPVDVQFLPDGSMLVSDDFAGVIYKITYQK